MIMEILNKKLNKEEILFLLQKSDSSFMPEPISTKIDLQSYAKKLADKALHFYAKENERLIGMTCCYMNDVNKSKAFISIICIDPDYFGKGIGRQLTIASEYTALKLGFRLIESEVHVNNFPSLKMYQKLGYAIDRNLDESHYIMRKTL